jgi:hypothetical protein
VIRPFRHQGVQELQAALFVLRFRPAIVILCVAASSAALLFYWRTRPRLLWRVIAGFSVLSVAAFAALSRINIYELMFHPVGKPSFAPASASKLDRAEMVIAVSLPHASRAYPIRIISYHHIVNDVLDGVPIVATY